MTRAQLDAFTQSTLAYVQANVEQAAIAQLNAVHFQVLDWKAQMSTDEWENVHVGITGSHMAHKKEVCQWMVVTVSLSEISLHPT